MLLSLISYHTQDPSLDTASSARPLNLIGYPGAYLSDLFFQLFGAAAFLFPLLTFLLAWRWIRSEEIEAGAIKLAGTITLTLSACAALSFLPVRLFSGNIRLGGTIGYATASYLVDSLNLAGAVLFTATAVMLSVYLVSTFTIDKVGEWLAGPLAWIERRREAFYAWRERLHQKSLEKSQEREVKRRAKAQAVASKTAELEAKTLAKAKARAAKAEAKRIRTKAATVDQAAAAADTPPWETAHDATPADAETGDPEYACHPRDSDLSD